jgi:prepilin peptidase CpaA
MESLVAPVLALAVTLVCAVTDARTGRIYNRITVPAIVAGLVWSVTAGGSVGAWASGLGLLAGLVPFGLAALRGWIGGGDVKLFGALGALLGPMRLAEILFLSFLLAALWAVLLLWRRDGAGAMGRRFAAGLKVLVRGTRVEPDDDAAGPSLRMGVFIFLGTALVIGAIWLTP